ncbi:putative ribonuclease H-like domain-containing protein [Tanacetum coccineum]
MKSSIKSLNTVGQNFSKAAVSVNTSRPINSTYIRPIVNSARKASNVLNKAHTHVRRPFNKSTTNKNSNLKEKVNTVKGDVTTAGPKAVVSNNKGNEANAVKASACWVWRPKQKGNPQLKLQEKGVIDSGCSRHMTGNKSYLSDYEEIDDTKCVVLSSDFKLLDENHVLLRVPRKDNMYSVDLKNIVPLGGLTCLFANATLDESNLWHRRLGHINLKTLNKLVRGNLVRGRKPALSFMRPFGCPITILNTLDHLGMFDGKDDEGFFIGYSTNSKAYTVFNNTTRIVEENLHVKFCEETPNIAGNGPNWLFDIDALTISMKYKPVVARNQTNSNVGTKENIDVVQRILLILDSNHQRKRKKRFKHQENEDSEVPNIKEPRVNQEQDANVNNTNNINTISPTVSVADIENNVVDDIVYKCIDDLNMPNLEEIVYSDDDEEVSVEADINNLATNVPASPIPTTRVHKYHPLEQIIGDMHSTPQTRRMTKNVIEHVEPKKMDVKSAFLYGTIEEEVYVCQPPSFEDPHFHEKVYKVEKALYGLHQAPRAWYETLSTYLLENGFRRGTIDKTLFIKKAKGLQVKQKYDGIFISQDKYVADILKKFDFTTVKTASTQIETNKALLKDEEAEDVDVYLYRSMIRSLMYLTASRPDIMFVVCACVRFQVTPKVSHLHAVKRIFRHLKGQPKLGLWYPRGSPFYLEAFFDSDYAGASLDRKSTTGDETIYKEWEDRMEMAATTSSSLVAEELVQVMVPCAKIPYWGGAEAQIRFKAASKQSNDPPLLRVNTLGSAEDNMKLMELMEHYTKLSELKLGLNLLLPVLVYAVRHSLPAVRPKLMLPGITYYC